ncbi:TPA: hypothetical protein NV714_002078 [Escherichia coli]|nr:hypothetical protein [Escherichia coli]
MKNETQKILIDRANDFKNKLIPTPDGETHKEIVQAVLKQQAEIADKYKNKKQK